MRSSTQRMFSGTGACQESFMQACSLHPKG